MELPTKVIKATTANPLFLILFGKPKCGKTTVLSQLEDNLLIDLEQGSNYVDALKVQVNSMKDLIELKNELKKKKAELKEDEYPYTYITFDTATALEDLILPLALKDYKNTPMGKNFKGKDVRLLANGGGYLYIREAYKKVISSFKGLSKYLILLGHTKDKTINVDGKELSENMLDLAGKLERIISSKADALGYIYRRKNQTIINFNGGGDTIVEARPKHLRGKEIVIAESDDDGNITTYWDLIFKKDTDE